MVKIRMMRMGSKKSPFYRVMAIDERKQRDGRPLEFLGTYDPKTNPESILIRGEAVDAWVKKGAQLSHTVKSLMRRAGRRAASSASRTTSRAPSTSQASSECWWSGTRRACFSSRKESRRTMRRLAQCSGRT